MLFLSFTVRGIAIYVNNSTFRCISKDVLDLCLNRSFTELILRLDCSSVQLRNRVLQANAHVSSFLLSVS